jgi:NAD-dependent deacetylase
MVDEEPTEKIGRLAGKIARAGRIVVFTGAGVSTESGIPDFRSPGGLWSKFDPEDFTLEKFLTSAETRRRQWQFLLSGGQIRDARPNAAHQAIAELERLGRLDCVITQNIDNLHQKAGNDPARVFELHGNLLFARCLSCGRRYPLSEIIGRSVPIKKEPLCGNCAGILKPDVIFFGEALPGEVLDEAILRAQGCDLLLVVGSSLVVYPAAQIPFLAKQAGAFVAVVNLSPTPADKMADVVIRAPAGEVMAALLAEVGRRVA